ncbi:hypothetical protein VTI74DRAFT_20 [Chaetomium olivicolor]
MPKLISRIPAVLGVSSPGSDAPIDVPDGRQVSIDRVDNGRAAFRARMMRWIYRRTAYSRLMVLARAAQQPRGKSAKSAVHEHIDLRQVLQLPYHQAHCRVISTLIGLAVPLAVRLHCPNFRIQL